MGKKGGWISAVKKVITFESKDTKEKKSEILKNKWPKQHDIAETVVTVPLSPPKTVEKTENEQSMHAYSVAIATAEAAEAAAAAARAAAAEVARLTVAAIRSGRSKEEAAAVKIQTAFRAHLARKALRALRGLVRLKSMIQGQSVQRQSMITLQCMQTLSRVESQIRWRRIRMSEDLQLKCEKEFEKMKVPSSTTTEHLAPQQHIQQKCEKELDKLRAPASMTNGGEDWNASAASKEQTEAKLQHKEEAAKKRERALAYAYSHQTVRKNLSKPENPNPMNPTYTDQLTDPFWGWNWLERWPGNRPWEYKNTQDHENISQKANSTLKTKPPASNPPHMARSGGPKTRPTGQKNSGPSKAHPQHQRRHTITGSLVKDGDKIPSPKTVSSTVDVNSKAKQRVVSRLGNGKTDKGPFGSAKKQLSYSLSSPGARRHSGPAKVDATS